MHDEPTSRQSKAVLTDFAPQWPCHGLKVRTGPVSKEVKDENIKPSCCRHRNAPDAVHGAIADCSSSTASKVDGEAATYPPAHNTMHLSRSGAAYSVAKLRYSSDADSDAESACHRTAHVFGTSTAKLAAHSIVAHSDSSADESNTASSGHDGSNAAVLAAHNLADLLSDSSYEEDEAVCDGQLDGDSAEICAAYSIAHLNGSSAPYLAAHSIKYLSSAERSSAASARLLSDTSCVESCPNPLHLNSGSAADFPPGSVAHLCDRRHMPAASLGMPAAAAAHAGMRSSFMVSAAADSGPSTYLRGKQGSLQLRAEGRGQAARNSSALRIRRRLHRLAKGFCAPAEAPSAPLQT